MQMMPMTTRSNSSAAAEAVVVAPAVREASRRSCSRAIAARYKSCGFRPQATSIFPAAIGSTPGPLFRPPSCRRCSPGRRSNYSCQALYR